MYVQRPFYMVYKLIVCSSQLNKLGNLLFGQTPAIGCYSQHFCMDAVKCLSILFKRMNGFGFPWLNAKCAPKKGAERRKNISIHLIKCLEIVAKL